MGPGMQLQASMRHHIALQQGIAVRSIRDTKQVTAIPQQNPITQVQRSQLGSSDRGINHDVVFFESVNQFPARLNETAKHVDFTHHEAKDKP